MKEYIRKVFYDFLSVINKMVKKKSRIVIYGGDSLGDNSEAIFRYLVDNTDYEIVCIANSYMKYELRKGVKFVNDTIINAIYYLLTSRIMFDSSLHRVKMKPTNTQLFVMFWHGSPLKFLRQEGVIKERDYYSYIYYAADFFKEAMKGCFAAEESQMILNGNPRCDYFMRDKTIEKLCKKTSKKVIWLPTYRTGLSVNYKGKEIPVLDVDNVLLLNQMLKDKDIILYIKPHPLQKISFNDVLSMKELSNIILISNKQLMEENIPFYTFLGSMDALLTDYSGVYFDFLLLDRPIGFVIDDFQTYKEQYGYIVDNPLDYMPGEKIYNMDELIDFFENLANDTDSYKEEREKINKVANYYTDGNNCRRTVDLIKDFMQ